MTRSRMLPSLFFYSYNLLCNSGIWISLCRKLIPTITQFTSVGLLCVGYEFARSCALSGMKKALQQGNLANAKLKEANSVKEQFLANVSHGNGYLVRTN